MLYNILTVSWVYILDSNYLFFYRPFFKFLCFSTKYCSVIMFYIFIHCSHTAWLCHTSLKVFFLLYTLLSLIQRHIIASCICIVLFSYLKKNSAVNYILKLFFLMQGILLILIFFVVSVRGSLSIILTCIDMNLKNTISFLCFCTLFKNIL